MTSLLQIFCLISLVAIFSVFGYHLLQAKKKENWVLGLNVFYSICLIVISIPLINLFSAGGMALTRLLITLFLVTPIEGFLINSITKNSFDLVKRILLFIIPPIAITSVIFIFIPNNFVRLLGSGVVMLLFIYLNYKLYISRIIKKYYSESFSIREILKCCQSLIRWNL